MRLIDAEELFNRVGQIKPKNKQQYEDVGMFMNMITNSNTVERRHKGYWVHKGQEIYCSECGEESGYNPFGASRFSDYCPSCGIEMESM